MELKLITVTEALTLGLFTKGTKKVGSKDPIEMWSISDKDGDFLYEEKKEGIEPFENVKIEILNGEVISIHF